MAKVGQLFKQFGKCLDIKKDTKKKQNLWVTINKSKINTQSNSFNISF